MRPCVCTHSPANVHLVSDRIGSADPAEAALQACVTPLCSDDLFYGVFAGRPRVCHSRGFFREAPDTAFKAVKVGHWQLVGQRLKAAAAVIGPDELASISSWRSAAARTQFRLRKYVRPRGPLSSSQNPTCRLLCPAFPIRIGLTSATRKSQIRRSDPGPRSPASLGSDLPSHLLVEPVALNA
jgi:hypothetical protein